jgi:hypothetical protein
MYEKHEPHYFDPSHPPQQVALTRVDIPTRDLLMLVLRLNLVQLFIALVFGVPAYLLTTMLGAA